MASKKDTGSVSAAAATLGRKGGPARAAALSASERSAIAAKGAAAQKKGTQWQKGGKARGRAAKKKG